MMMFGKIRKKILALGLAILLFAPLCSVYGLDAFTNSNNGNENYYREISQLISSTWDESFFGVATMSVGSDTMEVDNHTIDLDNPVAIVDGELVLPLEALQEIGVQITSDNKGVSMKKHGKSIEVEYGDKNMRVNGNRKGLRTAAALRKGKPVVPASVLAEDGLDFELDFDEKAGQIVITNEFQMARVLAKVKPGKALPKDTNATKTIVGPDGLYVIQYATEDQAKAACERLSGMPSVLYAEPDVIVTLNTDDEYDEPTNDLSSYPNGWGAKSIGRDEYLYYLKEGGKLDNHVVVAVLDTGLDATHWIFKGRCISGENIIDDNSNTNDIHGHGTHVAGTILDVAINAPNVQILPVKVLNDDGKGALSGVAAGIGWVAGGDGEAKANVINLSLGEMIIGSNTCSPTMHDNLDDAFDKNITVVVAAGNNNANAEDFCPAHYESVITVAASNKEDKPASFSNYGNCIDVAAPGVDICSASPGGGTKSMNGTSMACPHVTGAVALLYCDNPSIKPAEAKRIIRSSVESLSLVYNGRYYGSGILNIGKAAEATSYLEVTPACCELYCNTMQQLSVYKDGEEVKDVSTLDYSSDNENVATVSNTGIITAISSGIATITVTSEDENEAINGATCIVFVTDNNTDIKNAKDITEEITADNQSPISVPITKPRQIRYYQFVPEVSGHYVIESANSVDSTDPFGKLYNATNKNLIYQNDDGAGNKNFRISCNLTEGEEYYIEAACYGTGIGSYTFSISLPILPDGIEVSPTEVEIKVGETIRIASAIYPPNATERTVEWTSSDTSVAMVSQTGLVTAKGKGTADIKATMVSNKELEQLCRVQVDNNDNPETPFDIEANKPKLVEIEEPDEIRYYEFTTKFSGFHIIESTNPTGGIDPYCYLYDSNKVQIAADDDSAGNRNFRISIYLTGDQTYNIGATCYGAGIGSYTLSITEPQSPTSITISPTAMIMDLNEARRVITATVLPYNYNASKKVVWDSSDPEVAVVDSLGGVCPISIGDVIITASTKNEKNEVIEACCYVTVAETNTSFDKAISVIKDDSVPVSVTAARQIRYYKFIPTDSGNYTIESAEVAGSTDPYVCLYFANKAQITSDDDGAGNRNFKISYNLIEGQTYYIGTACFGTGTGSYVFSIKYTPLELTKLLYESNIRYPMGDSAHTYNKIQVDSAGVITIALTGAKNDIYTVSLRKDNEVLAESEPSRVIELKTSVEAGNYEVVVKKEEPDINGLYSLTVTLEISESLQ